MTTVFLGGSRKISRLNDIIRKKLEELVNRELAIVIGDANGADKAMQRQLADLKYGDVVVYFVGRRPRNNEGGWQTREVVTLPGARGFDFYAAKDREMAIEAQAGLMLWDGVSRGTLANVERLVFMGKPASVYVSSLRRFVSVRTEEEFRDLAATASDPDDDEGDVADERFQPALALGEPASPKPKARRPRKPRTTG